MKNILKTSIFAFLLVAFTACTNDTDPVASAGGTFSLLTPATGTVMVLSPANATATATTIVWDPSTNTVQTAPSYTVEIAKAGTSFATPVPVGTTSSKFLALTVEQLNGFLNPLIYTPYVATDVNVRVKSMVGTGANAVISYSNTITLKLTPYSTALPKLGVPGNHQGWTPSNAATLPLVASSGYGKTNYEGYMNLNGDYKFLSPKPDGTIDWNGDGADFGDDGSFSGVLKNLGESNCNAPAGYYLVKANTAPTGPGSLQYSATPITTWGVIGDATPGIWATSTPMTYSTTTKKWTVTVLLTGGKQLKFRANDAWLINLGKFDASQTGDNYAGANMTYNAANNLDGPASSGTYTITLDLSNPRDYKYTIQ
jgi:starch-binding outer membrane protein SusE/F